MGRTGLSRRAWLAFPSLVFLAGCPQEGAYLVMEVEPEAERGFLDAVRAFAESNAYSFSDQDFADGLPHRRIELRGLRTHVSVWGNGRMKFEANFTRKYNLFDLLSSADLADLHRDFSQRVSSVEGVRLVSDRPQ